MSTDRPWRDALRRASLGSAGATVTGPETTAAPAAPESPVAQAAGDSPRLAKLLREREALEGRMRSLLAPSASDARYAVAPLATRRAEFARWSNARDQRREQAAPAAAEAQRTPVPRMPRPGEPLPELRATPGEAVPAGRIPVDPSTWMQQRDQRAPRAQPVDEYRATPSDRGRPLRVLDVEMARSRARRENASANGPADPLERQQERVRRRLVESRLARTEAAQALTRARNSIPDGWEDRIRERIPGLGRADPYVRGTLRKLSVVVGSLQEIGDKSERLRESAQAMRELQRADEAGDDARRDRALERLKARRAEDAYDD